MATVCTGFGHATTLCLTTGTAGNKVFDTVAGTHTYDATTPRTGNHCLQIALTAGNTLGWNTSTLGTSQTDLVVSGWIYFSTDPSATTQFAYFGTAAASESISFEYVPSTNLLHLWSAATSTGQMSTDTVAPNTWTHIDVRFNVAANPWVIEWRINGVDQTTFQPARAASTVASWRFGATFALTGTCRYDDWILSTTSGDYPFGPHKVELLTPTACTLSGTASNWNTFTANGTLAAWNAATALANIDEVPPVMGGSADGFCQINLLSTDYVAVDMSTYALAGGEAVSALRMLAPGWATSTSAATIGFRSFNGTTETVLYAVADPGFDNTNSTTAWVAKMCTLADFTTQAEIDALEFRVGFSGDASPDIGIHAIYGELAVKEATAGGETVRPRMRRIVRPKHQHKTGRFVR